MSGLNRDNNPVPLYHQLKDVILRAIVTGKWKVDDRLPTEGELANQYGVSKITVRQALRELTTLGYVRREQGRGTFVQRPHLEQGPRELTSFTEDMRRHGQTASSRVLDHGVVPATPEIAARLKIKPHEPVFRLQRLRLADGEPIGIQTSHLPLVLVPGIDAVAFTHSSLYEVLFSHYQLRAAGAKEVHHAILIDAEDAALLDVPPKSAGMLAERTALLSNGKPLEFVQSVMRGDRCKIVLDLTAADVGPHR
jgi:GntR family transcriptional regulator